MKLLCYVPPGSDFENWINDFSTALPQADIRFWQEGDNAPADYALVWRPPAAMLAGRHDLKAIFNLGAGVDAILQLGEALPTGVPLIRVDDAGMAIQMANYVTHAVLGYFGRHDIYRQQAARGEWRSLPAPDKRDFSIGILGMGVLGSRIAEALAHFDFPLNGWSRTPKNQPGVRSFVGDGDLDAFLRASRVLVCILPLTDATRGIVNRQNLQKLQKGVNGAYLINVARGGHVVEADLLTSIQEGQVAAATLDVFEQEPLPPAHPFWQEQRITITPHISAVTVDEDTVRQIRDKILALENGQSVNGVVDRTKGY